MGVVLPKKVQFLLRCFFLKKTYKFIIGQYDKSSICYRYLLFNPLFLRIVNGVLFILCTMRV